MKKKFLIFILALVMTLIFVPGIASAANTEEFGGGSGTEKDPYLIFHSTHLNNVRNYPDAHFKLTGGIEFDQSDFAPGGEFYNDGAGWEPIGTKESPFTGTFDGGGFALINLYINASNGSDGVHAGLFGYNEGIIKNLGIVDSNISATTETIYVFAGGIAGENYGTIKNCYNTGDVIARDNVGGVAGYNYGAQQFHRVNQVLKLAIWGATIMTTLTFLVGELMPEKAVSIFTTDEGLIARAAEGFRKAGTDGTAVAGHCQGGKGKGHYSFLRP